MVGPRRLPALLSLGVVAVLPFFAGCAKKGQAWPDVPGPKVVTTFAPIYCFAANVAGDDATVRNLMFFSGPHGGEHLTLDDARLMRKADVLFISGLGLDTGIAKSLKAGASNDRLVIADLGGTLDKKLLLEGACHHDHGGGPHEHGDDPHVWLGPDHAALMVGAVRDALKNADPAHAAGYDRRAAEYVAKLAALKAEGVALLKPKTEKELITFHDSMAYFADAFGLHVIGVVRKSPTSDPSASEIQDLVKTCVRKQVRVVAVEPQYSRNDSARTILGELTHKGVAGATFVDFDPLETVTPEDLTPDWYERKMRTNLKNLADVLK